MKCQCKADFNMTKFLKSVDLCEDNIIFEDLSGDRLDLKSQLCKYLFLTFTPGTPPLTEGSIACSERDAALLSEFLCINER